MAVKIRLKTVEIMLLVLVWLVLIASPILFRTEDISDWRQLIAPLETIAPLFLIFIINRFILVPELLFRNRNLLYFISVFGMIAAFTLGAYLITFNKRLERTAETEFLAPPRHLPPDARPPGPDINPSHPGDPVRGRPIPPYANLLIFSILMVGFDTGLKISFKLALTEREKAKLETENISNQLAFLRNQVSPHFFMNTLNNIHAQIDIDTEEAKESVIRLSKLMRHLIYDSETDKLLLRKEMEFISNYVDLMRLRYSDKVKIELFLPDTLPDKSIPPLLFTSFVENAFKHGISYENPSFINIKFSCNNELLTMEIRNSNHKGIVDKEASGIGIENSRKRLKLLYDDNFKLEILNGKDVHYVKLEVPL